jgi:hypothetical protein
MRRLLLAAILVLSTLGYSLVAAAAPLPEIFDNGQQDQPVTLLQPANGRHAPDASRS